MDDYSAELVRIVYPEKRFVAAKVIIGWAIDAHVNELVLTRGEDQYDAIVREVTEMYDNPSVGFDNAKLYLEDIGQVTFAYPRP